MTKTSADFKVANATADDLAQLNDALAYGSLSPAAESLIERAADLGKTIVIIHDGNDRNQGDTIYWDPTSALVTTVNGVVTGTQSAAMGLFHEMGHADDPNTNTLFGQKTGDAYDNMADKTNILNNEDTIADELGEPKRDNHNGTPVDLDNSTEHTQQGGYTDTYYSYNGVSGQFYEDPWAGYDPYEGGDTNPGDYDPGYGGWGDYGYYARSAPKAIDTSSKQTDHSTIEHGKQSVVLNKLTSAPVGRVDSVQQLVQSLANFSAPASNASSFTDSQMAPAGSIHAAVNHYREPHFERMLQLA